MTRGVSEAGFVTIEGIDGSGKSTVAERVTEDLKEKGYDAVRTKEPTDLETGRVLRERLGDLSSKFDEEIDGVIDSLYFTADRVFHNGYFIDRWLGEGRNVISDRYYHSTLAYQASQGMDMDFLAELTDFFIGEDYIRRPDATVYLHVEVDTALERLGDDDGVREKFERRDQLEEIDRNYTRAFDVMEDKRIDIDAEQPLEDVVDDTVTAIEPFMVRQVA